MSEAEGDKHDLIERDVVMRLLGLEDPQQLALEMDTGRCPRPARQAFDGLDPRGRKRWKPLWARGEVVAAMQALALKKFGQVLGNAQQ